MMSKLVEYISFWGVWMIIPFLVDGISSVVVFFSLIFSRIKRNKEDELEFYPAVSIIVPVYNSEKTLEQCIDSIAEQNYPKEKIEILLVDNGSKDQSFEAYIRAKRNHISIKIWWLKAENGKFKALNEGLYLSQGKYVINIDSDGYLHEDAVKNMIVEFEKDKSISALTGVILTDPEQIKETKRISKRLMQVCEFFEYSEAFLVGRIFESKHNRLFTMAGAFSAFRKELIMKTSLYNGETLGEDTHMTLQIKTARKGSVKICNTAYFFTDPIESFDKLYAQRQRWQRGEIEIGALFSSEKLGFKLKSILNVTLIKDHTFLFPRIIWMFGTVYLAAANYSVYTIIIFNIILYGFYSIIEMLNFMVVNKYLKDLPQMRSYYRKRFLVVFLMPAYRIILFFVRAIGVINAMDYESKWKRKTLSAEAIEIKEYIKDRIKGKKRRKI